MEKIKKEQVKKKITIVIPIFNLFISFLGAYLILDNHIRTFNIYLDIIGFIMMLFSIITSYTLLLSIGYITDLKSLLNEIKKDWESMAREKKWKQAIIIALLGIIILVVVIGVIYVPNVNLEINQLWH